MRVLLPCIVAAALVGCNNESGGRDAGNRSDSGAGSDAVVAGECGSNSPRCSNCVDDDMDGKRDGFDPECTGPIDNDEGSFGLGLPDPPIDAVLHDCFFDGNTGAGDDSCIIHVCCILGAPDRPSCPIGANSYNVNECPPPLGARPLTQKCRDVCGAITLPGCDCFGCCTMCDGSGACRAIYINPTVSPNCDASNINDPGADGMLGTVDDPCRSCTASESCGNPACGDASCVLCPGQDTTALSSVCGGVQACPRDFIPCAADGTCADAMYCANGCCIGPFEL